jgi:hypothetical protein
MGPPREIIEQRRQGGGLMQSVTANTHSLGAAAYQEENNMLKEALEKLISLGEPIFREEEDGRVYTSRNMTALEPPEAAPIHVQTLAGFRDLYKLRDQSAEPALILIEDHLTVRLIAKKLDEWRRRECFVLAKVPSDAPRFRFGQWMDPEEFCIAMQTLFEDSEFGHDHKKIVKLVSNLAAEAVTISNDDGFSQQVVTKQGMVNKSEEKVSPRVSLSPYRTFREIGQPTSTFILRLRSRTGAMPVVALFEADGGSWREDAMKSIREYFQKECEGADIVA